MSLYISMCVGAYLLISLSIMKENSKTYAQTNILITHDSTVLLDFYSHGSF
jgi:hypothetical protein